MIILDDIIYSLQKHGGISRYWKNLSAFIEKRSESLVSHTTLSINCLRRLNLLIPLIIKGREKILVHSSYFRLFIIGHNVKIVYTVHDLIRENSPGLKGMLAKWVLRYTVRKSDGIIVVSECTKEQLLLVARGLSLPPVEVIHHGIDERFRRIDSIQKVSGMCLFVGRRDNHKRFDLAVEFVRKHGFSLVIVGQELTSSEEGLLYGAEYSVLSNLTDGDLVALYNQAEFLLYPSDQEGFGLPLIEAMSSRAIVVAQSIPIVKEVCGNNFISVYVENAALERLRNDGERINDLLDRSEALASKYTWGRSSNKHIKFYQQILNKYEK